MAEAVLASIASPVNHLTPRTSLAKVAARRGQGDVWPHLDAAMTAADGSAERAYIGPVRLARAEARWLEGDLTAARQEAELADDAFTDATDPWLNGEIAVWLLRTGSPRTKSARTGRALPAAARRRPSPGRRPFDALGCPYDAALALLGVSDELALRRALDICDSLGAVATARIIRQKMRSLGIRSVPVGQRAATRENPLGLTEREQEVLELLCEGRTNAGIAAKLVISPKTVDHHVSSVLAKPACRRGQRPPQPRSGLRRFRGRRAAPSEESRVAARHRKKSGWRQADGAGHWLLHTDGRMSVSGPHSDVRAS